MRDQLQVDPSTDLCYLANMGVSSNSQSALSAVAIFLLLAGEHVSFSPFYLRRLAAPPYCVRTRIYAVWHMHFARHSCSAPSRLIPDESWIMAGAILAFWTAVRQATLTEELYAYILPTCLTLSLVCKTLSLHSEPQALRESLRQGFGDANHAAAGSATASISHGAVAAHADRKLLQRTGGGAASAAAAGGSTAAAAAAVGAAAAAAAAACASCKCL